MKRKIKIATKLLFMTVTITVVVILVSGLMAIQGSKSSLKKEVFNKLIAAREMKAQQIEDYMRMIRGQASTMSENRMLVDAMRAFQDDFQALSDGIESGTIDTEGDDDGLRDYYRDQFIPRLEKNQEEPVSGEDYWPKTRAARYVQSRYIADNAHATGQKDKLMDAGDGTAYSEHHAAFHPILRRFLLEFGYYDIFLIELKSGHIVYSVFKEIDFGTSLETDAYRDSNFAASYRLAKAASKKDETHLVDFQSYAPSYGTMASFIACPIYDGEEKIGVLAFQMPVDRINETMTNKKGWANAGLGETGETYIVGDDSTMRNQSRLLLESPEDYLKAIAEGDGRGAVSDRIRNLNSSIGLQKVRTSGAEEALSGKSGTMIFPGYLGGNVLSAYRPLEIEGLKWAIMSEIGEAEAFRLFDKLQDRMVMSGSVLLAVAIYLSYFLALSLTRPIRDLERAARDLTSGNLDRPIERRSRDEIGDLAEDFETMRSQLARNISELETQRDELDARVRNRTEELDEALRLQEKRNVALEQAQLELVESEKKIRASEQRVSTIIQSSADGIVSINTRGTIELFNTAAEEMFGYKSEEVIGKNVKILMPKAIAIEHDYHLESYDPTRPSSIVDTTSEVEAKRRNGATFPLELHVTQVTIDGARLFIGMLRDITERRAMQKRERKAALEAKLLDRGPSLAAEAKDFEDALHQVIEMFCTSMAWAIGHVYLWDENGQRLDSADIWYLKDEAQSASFKGITEEMTFARGEGLPGRILETGGSVWIEDLKGDKNFPRNKKLKALGVSSGVGFPVKSDGAVIAILEFFLTEPAQPDLARIFHRESHGMGFRPRFR
jgi:PAS domain S-box-containing protein